MLSALLAASPESIVPPVEMTSATGRLIWLDWMIIALFILSSLAIGIYLSRRARGSVSDYFTSSGSMPWYLLGTSMVATTFAADTPLALSGFVYSKGISGNWFWWCQAAVTMLGVFFFAHLWKRAALTTDNEFVDLRYSGKSAKALRGFRALYFAIIYNCIVIGWVNLAMVKIVTGLLEPTDMQVAIIDGPIESTLRSTGFIKTDSDIILGLEEGASSGTIISINKESSILSLDPESVAPGEAVIQEEYSRFDVSVSQGGSTLATIDINSSGTLTLAELASQLDALPGVVAQLHPNSGRGSVPATTLVAGSYPVSQSIGWDTIGEYEGQTPLHLLSSGTALRSYNEDIAARLGKILTAKILMICFIVTVAYCAIGGFWSVVVTDFIQFIIAMGGAIFLAYLAVSHFGGLSDLMETAKAGFGEGRAEAMTTLMPLKNAAEIEATKLVDPGLFALDPSVNFALTDFWQWLVYVMVFWYAVGFTDGGSYFAQRMLSAKTEQDAKLGYMWFGIMHYCVRMWPWLLVGLAGACLFPTLSHHQALNPSATAYDPEMNYIYAMRVFLMPGLLGIIVASFLAAYMSTISTQVNLAASYLVSDFYRPFIVKGAAEKHYVGVATVTTVVIAFIGIIVTLFMSSIAGAWFLLSSLNAGIGLVYILRWYWWRISAWSEISCFATLLILTALMQCFVYGDNWRLVGEKIDSNQKVLAMIEADPETYAETAEDIEQLDPNYYANSVSGIPVFYLRWLEGDGIITRINGIDLDSTRQYTVRGKIPAELLKADNELTDEQATRLERLRDETTLAEIDSGITVPDDEYAVVQTLNESWGTFPYKIIPLVFGSLFVWVLVTFITAPVDEEKLKAFYRKVRPGGPGWTRIAALCPEIPEKDNKIGARPFLGWATAVLAIYSALFGIAQLLLGSWGWAIGLLAITTIAGVALWNLLKQKD